MSLDYGQALSDHGLLQSTGTVGDALDNALAESWVDSLKTEVITDRVWRSISQLELAIVEYIGWFNHARQHSSLGFIAPAECATPLGALTARNGWRSRLSKIEPETTGLDALRFRALAR